MPSILNTSLSGLLSFQKALSTTTHNISNASTEGYSRQRVELSSLPGQAFGNGYFGRGVQAASVTRVANEFVNLRLRNAITDNGRTEMYTSLAGRLDSLMASGNAGLSSAISSFFDTVQEVAADPSSSTPRKLLLSEAEALVDRFRFTSSELNQLDTDMNRQIQAYVGDINGIADEVARLNDDIVIALGVANGNPPNDLLDQRDQRINDLADLVAVQTVTQDNGSINVFVGNGQPLLIGGTAQPLTTVTDPLDPTLVQVGRDVGAATPAVISSLLTGGAVGGLLEFRRDVVGGVRNEIGRVATVLADQFNAQHRAGMDLDGNLGQDFFVTPPPQSLPSAVNTGTATVTTTVTDTTGLTASDYLLNYDGATYTLTRADDGTAVSGPGPLVMDGMQVSISPGALAGDSFLVRPVVRGAELLAVTVRDPDRIAAAVPVRAAADFANLGDAAVDQPGVADVTNANLLDDVDIVFLDPPTTFDVIDVATTAVIATGVPYVEGAAIGFNGWTTQITGTPVAGDQFRIEANVGGAADNRNALALASLQTTQLIEGRLSFEEGYSATVGGVGITARQAQLSAEAHGQLLSAAEAAREEVSGVNLDEEAIDLTRYQQAYQAMAQVINTSNTLFDTLLLAVGR